MDPDQKSAFSGKKVLLTGGLGMIGSTIALKLVESGADITIVDACIEPYGSNLFNIEAVRDRIRVNICDIRDKASMKVLVRGQDFIFNLAGQVSHNDSLSDPYLDADINYIGHLNVLECLRRYNAEAVVLHAGSRLQFGRIEYLPVDERHPLKPLTPYALNKTAAENTYLFYHEVYGIKCVLFRIANPFGPRSQMRHHKYSMINWFIRQAMEGKPIRVFGDGSQIRDYIYVDDLADAFIRSAITPACYGGLYNVGSGVGTRFRDMVELIVRIVGSGTIEYVGWPDNYINVETGDYITNIEKLRDVAGWRPITDLETGVQHTYEYYRVHRSQYW